MKRAGFVVGIVLTALLLVTALLSLVWTPWPPEQIDMGRRLASPSAAASRMASSSAGKA